MRLLGDQSRIGDPDIRGRHHTRHGRSAD
jgi:hypothetical protein